MSRGQGAEFDPRTLALDLVPPWARRLGVPVWVTDPDRNLRFVNGRAATLLAVSASECLGKPCYAIVSGVDLSGEPFCRPDCQLEHLVRNGSGGIEPIEMGIVGAAAKVRWVKVLAIPVTGSRQTNTLLVHCALDHDKSRRVETYLSRLLSHRLRSSSDWARRPLPLTKRESEVLALLAAGENTRSLSERSYVSHATVRNHVQHVLSKLGAH